jgi:hypothetical protein
MGHRSALCRAGFLLLFPLVLAAAYAQETAALGPVERISSNGTSLTVLAQSYDLTPAVSVTIGSKKYRLTDALKLIHPGTYIAVVGTDDVQGRRTATEIIVSRRAYVPGASDVFVSGRVTSYDSLTGQAKLGGLQVDATSMFASNSTFRIGVGARIEVLGRQAIGAGVVSALELKLLNEASSVPTTSTGSGASLQSISGTGAAKSTQSISGTGATLGVQSISGTGASATV